MYAHTTHTTRSVPEINARDALIDVREK
jgi:hypothetical protein